MMTNNRFCSYKQKLINNHKSSIDDDKQLFAKTKFTRQIINHLLMMTNPLDLGLFSILLLLPKSLKLPINSQISKIFFKFFPTKL